MEYCEIVDTLDLKPEDEIKLVREFYEKESLWDRVTSYLKARVHTLDTGCFDGIVQCWKHPDYDSLVKAMGIDDEVQCEQAWDFIGDHDLWEKFEEMVTEKLADRLPQPEEDDGECPDCNGTGTGNPHLGWRGVGCSSCQGTGYIRPERDEP